MKQFTCLIGLFAFCSTTVLHAQEKPLPLKILYVGNDSSRAGEYTQFLQKRFQSVSKTSRDDFDPKLASDANVVLLDWSQSETKVGDAVSPFGRLEEWSKPTVLLGSAGLLFACSSEVIGGAG